MPDSFISQIPSIDNDKSYVFGEVLTNYQGLQVKWPGTTELKYEWTLPGGGKYTYLNVIETEDRDGIWWNRSTVYVNGVLSYQTDWSTLGGYGINYGFIAGYSSPLVGNYNFSFYKDGELISSRNWTNVELDMTQELEPITFTPGEVVKFEENSMAWFTDTGKFAVSDGENPQWQVTIYDSADQVVWQSPKQSGVNLNVEWDSSQLLTSSTTSRSISDSRIRLVPMKGFNSTETVSKSLSSRDDVQTTETDEEEFQYKITVSADAYTIDKLVKKVLSLKEFLAASFQTFTPQSVAEIEVVKIKVLQHKAKIKYVDKNAAAYDSNTTPQRNPIAMPIDKKATKLK